MAARARAASPWVLVTWQSSHSPWWLDLECHCPTVRPAASRCDQPMMWSSCVDGLPHPGVRQMGSSRSTRARMVRAERVPVGRVGSQLPTGSAWSDDLAARRLAVCHPVEVAAGVDVVLHPETLPLSRRRTGAESRGRSHASRATARGQGARQHPYRDCPSEALDSQAGCPRGLR